MLYVREFNAPLKRLLLGGVFTWQIVGKCVEWPQDNILSSYENRKRPTELIRIDVKFLKNFPENEFWMSLKKNRTIIILIKFTPHNHGKSGTSMFM